MSLRNSADRYGAVSQALHWLVAVLVVAAWLTGQFGDALPRGAAREAGLLAHIFMGLAIVALVVARLLWRLGDPPPRLESSALGRWLDRAGQLTHYALYALLVAVPLVGIVLQFARGEALPVFGLIEIASPWAADRTFARNVREVHETLANIMMVLALLHAAAALFHHLVLRPAPRR